MKSSNMTWIVIVFFILIFGNAALGNAAATVTASSSGNGRFVVRGEGLAGFEGVFIEIKYDKTALANPRVTQGSLISGMPMVTHNEPGLLDYTGVDPFPKTRSGSGPIAEITFDTVQSPTANVLGTATLKDPNGSVLLVQSFVVQVTGSNSDASNIVSGIDGAGAGTGSGSSGSGTASVTVSPAATGNVYPVVLGSVSMPEAGTTAVAKTNDQASPPASETEKIQKQTTEVMEKEVVTPPTGEAPPQKSPQTVPQENKAAFERSVLEQFREYQGEKSPKSLIALLKSAMAGNRQEPPLALSDGNTSVKIFVELPVSGKVAPNFALKEAKLVSLKKSSDSAWVVEILPNKGTFEAAVIVLEDNKTIKLPFTVAPPLSAGHKIGKGEVLTEADFITFLKELGTEKVPRFDLNGDGKRDYIDDYIFTVNFLIKADTGKPAAGIKTQSTK